MRIGIVNDMLLAREALRRVVVSVPGYIVAWLATDGAEAILKADRDAPDLILMDLIMPGVDGVEATRRIMAESPCPILVVTATVSGNFGKVYEAMGLGALDAVDTPSLGPQGDVRGGDALLAKVAKIAKLGVRGECRSAAPSSDAAARRWPAIAPSRGDRLVDGGAECADGGDLGFSQDVGRDGCFDPAHRRRIRAGAGTLALGAKRTHGSTSPSLECAARPGQIVLAATDDHLVIEPGLAFRYISEPRALCFRPSVDVFFNSVANHWPGPGVGVLLTGMFRDGAAGLLALRHAGWHTIAQDKATSVVWGMPGAAVEIGAAAQVLPLAAIGPAVVDRVLQKS